MTRLHQKRALRPELSAQGIRKHPNPMLARVLPLLKRQGSNSKDSLLVVDCGCGQLRHVKTLLSLSERLVLVDTVTQLKTPHDFFGQKACIRDFVRKQWPRKAIHVIDSVKFMKARLNADLVFSINVLDVTPRKTRTDILRACLRNLGPKGRLIAIVPRNYTWTLRICTRGKVYQDGFVFGHPNGETYYRNWGGASFQSSLLRHGFKVEQDLSTYRQVCVICAAKRVVGGRRA